MASAPASEYIDPFAPVVLRLPSSSTTTGSSSSSSSLELHVLPYGLTMHRLLIHPNPTSSSTSQSRAEDLLTGPEHPRDHHTFGRHFFGPIVGRFANRLPSGKSDFSYDGDGGVKKGQVDLPEWGGEGICHHGGPVAAGEGQDGEKEAKEEVVKVKRGEVKPQEGPFDRVVWTKLEDAKKAELFDKASSSPSTAIFALHSVGSPAGQQGFEGDVRVEVRVELVAGNDAQKQGQPSVAQKASSSSLGSVRVEYRAKLLTPEVAVTPFNLTHHWGFNLSASSSSSSGSRIDDHHLHLLRPNTGRLALDARGVATGEVLPLDEAHGWANAQQGGKRIAKNMPGGGYDDFYLWPSAAPGEGDDKGEELPAVALLSSPSSPNSKEAPLSLLFRTDQHGVQLYTANGQPASPAPNEESGGAMKVAHRRDGSAGEQGQGNAERSAAFLEFGEPHACFLRPGLQEYVRGGGGKEGKKDVGLLRRGETYVNRVEVEVLRG